MRRNFIPLRPPSGFLRQIKKISRAGIWARPWVGLRQRAVSFHKLFRHNFVIKTKRWPRYRAQYKPAISTVYRASAMAARFLKCFRT